MGLGLVIAEVAAGDGGDAGLVEEAAGEAHAVGIEGVGAGVDVEGALGYDRDAEAGRPEALDEDVAAGGAWRRCSTVAHTSGLKAATPPYRAGAGGEMKASG